MDDAQKPANSFFSSQVSYFAPKLITAFTFVCGVVLLISGSTPLDTIRLKWVKDFIPLPIMEISHFLGSVIGAVLLFLAWGLAQRVDAAYVLTVVLLLAGACFSLLRGFNYEEALLLVCMVLVTLPFRKFYYRKSSLTMEPLTGGWIAAILATILCVAALGTFSYRHVVYSDNLWWKFELADDASRFLRAWVGIVVFLLAFSLFRLLKPSVPRFTFPSAGDFEQAKAIAKTSPRCLAWLALSGDKSFLFSEQGNSFLMYRVQGRSWVALGDPIGPERERRELAYSFRKLSDAHKGWSVFFEISKEDLPVYLDLGLSILKIGEEAHVSLEKFSLEDADYREFEHALRKIDAKGFEFNMLSPPEVPAYLDELKRVSDAWLDEKRAREKGFSLGFFDKPYLSHFPVGIVKRNGRILAFIVLWPGAGKREFSADLVRFIPHESPNGMMDYLFTSVLLWGKEEGYGWFNMGMAPLAGLENNEFAPLWNRLGAFVYNHGENFYNFQGLRQYKEKFHPVWEPKYLASPGGLTVPRILADIAALNSRGLRGIFSK